GMIKKRNPLLMQSKDFFEAAEIAKQKFSKIIKCNAQQVAVISSVSYGLMSAFKNLPLNNGNTALVITEEFPSDFYTIHKWCGDNDKVLKTIAPPVSLTNRGEEWNKNILNSIDEDTAVIVLSSIHWSDGTLF